MLVEPDYSGIDQNKALDFKDNQFVKANFDVHDQTVSGLAILNEIAEEHWEEDNQDKDYSENEE